MRIRTKRKSLLFPVVLCMALTVSAAQNAQGADLSKTRRHDFGLVALGADAEFRFELTNIYNSDLKLVSLSSSCSCISAKASVPLLKPGETGAVIARLNTTGQHLRDKSAAITVRLEVQVNGFPKIDTVQLFVSGYIRPDVLLTPGSVEFGSVAEGAAAERTLTLEYTGHPGWGITKIDRSQPFIFARAEEIKREQGNVTYKITARLKEDAPPGYIRDVLRFTTNELQQGRTEPVEILLPVRGVVTAVIQAKPSPMQMGIITPGETAVKNIVVRSETPFRITNVAASDNRFRFAFADQESAVQLITVSFSPRQVLSTPLQDIAEVIHISTSDSRQSVITVDVVGRVMQASREF